MDMPLALMHDGAATMCWASSLLQNICADTARQPREACPGAFLQERLAPEQLVTPGSCRPEQRLASSLQHCSRPWPFMLQIDKATKDLKTNNLKLKGLVTSMRSGRNFCIDVTLICVLLGIGLYLFTMFKS